MSPPRALPRRSRDLLELLDYMTEFVHARRRALILGEESSAELCARGALRSLILALVTA